MAIDVDARPHPDAPLEELAEYFAAHRDEIAAFDSWTFRVKRRLGEVIRDFGPIPTSSGNLMKDPSKYEYPPEVAQEFPTLGKHVITATVETIEQAERVLSLVTEEVPSAEIGHTIKVSGTLANKVIRGGGDAAKRLLDLRVASGPLVVE